MAKFNYRELTRSVASSPIAAKRVNTIVEKQFAIAKQQMITDFNEDEVTKEIESGVGAANVSNTLNSEGDLFSFIGFDADDKPVDKVRAILETDTKLISSKLGTPVQGKVQYKFSLRIPTQEIKEATPLPFEQGQSWAEGIEKGISGFGNYIRGIFRSPEPSHSGGGVQSKDIQRTQSFKTRKYLSKIFAQFVEKFK